MNDAPIDTDRFAELQASAGEDFVDDLLGTFFEEAPRMLRELRAACDAGDADAFRRAAHSLKSNGQTFGAVRLGALARGLELQGLPADAGALDAVEEAYAAARAALTALRHG